MPMLQKSPKLNVTFKESSFEELIPRPKSQGLPSSWLRKVWHTDETRRIDITLIVRVRMASSLMPPLQNFHWRWGEPQLYMPESNFHMPFLLWSGASIKVMRSLFRMPRWFCTEVKWSIQKVSWKSTLLNQPTVFKMIVYWLKELKAALEAKLCPLKYHFKDLYRVLVSIFYWVLILLNDFSNNPLRKYKVSHPISWHSYIA